MEEMGADESREDKPALKLPRSFADLQALKCVLAWK